MIKTAQTQRWSIALALLAAVATAACCVYARVDLPVAVWRCIVAFAGVWVYQRFLVVAWTILEAEPIPVRIPSGSPRAGR